MIQDFGSGMTIDELIGLSAWHIAAIKLPPELIFISASRAAGMLMQAGMENYTLAELWGDGHSVWNDPKTQVPVVITASGRISQS